MGGHHGINHVLKMQYMLGCFNEQEKEKGMRGSSKAPMSPGNSLLPQRKSCNYALRRKSDFTLPLCETEHLKNSFIF